MSSQEKAVNKLVDIGFTQLEAEIYLHLIKSGESTGYSIAKAINKPTANTYKAIESLKVKGAIEIAMSKSRLCNARPWKELLANYRKIYETNISELDSLLSALPERESNELVYQIENTQQVIEQTKNALKAAKKVVFADIHPAAVELFKTELENAAERGVEVRIKLYEKSIIKGAHIVMRKHGKEVYTKIKAVSITVCVDGEETILAVFDESISNVIQAFRTRSPLMNMQLYSGLLYELILTDVKQYLADNEIDKANKVLAETNHLNPYSQEGPPFKHYLRTYQTDS